MDTAQSYSSPIFIAEKIQTLQSALDALGWISIIQPLARIGEDEKGTFPEVYYNDGSRKNIRMFPEGDSWAFFMIEGDINQVDEYAFDVPLSLTVWFDMTKVYPSKLYDYSYELLQDVVNVLHLNSCNDLKINTTSPFAGFSQLEQKQTQHLMLPYSAFKIDFNCLCYFCETRPDAIHQTTYNDWFLPSQNLLIQFDANLKQYGIGGFANAGYWSSSEYNATTALYLRFSDHTSQSITKDSLLYVRAARSFTDTTGIYSLRDIGPSGGYIGYIINNGDGTSLYYEAASTDQSTSKAWSTITNIAIGTTGIAIGTGAANTAAIEAQESSEMITRWVNATPVGSVDYDTLTSVGNKITSAISLGNHTALVSSQIPEYFAIVIDHYYKFTFSEYVLNSGTSPYLKSNFSDQTDPYFNYTQLSDTLSEISFKSLVSKTDCDLQIINFDEHTVFFPTDFSVRVSMKEYCEDGAAKVCTNYSIII